MQRQLIARAQFPMAVEAQGHKTQSSGLVQRLVVLRLEQRVPASLSPSLAGIYIIFFPCLLVSFSPWQQRKVSMKGIFLCAAPGKVQRAGEPLYACPGLDSDSCVPVSK